MISITERERSMVLDILKQTAPPGCAVWAFGSRLRMQHKPYSDLDLAIVADKPLNLSQWGLLREAFDDSDLPYRVDIVDYRAASESFRRVIDKRYEVII